MTLLAALTQTPWEADIEKKLATINDTEAEWFSQYVEGLRMCLRGFLVSNTLAGKTFHEVAKFVYGESKGKVLIIAAQHEGHLRLNYIGNVEAGQVLMAMSPSRKDLFPFEDATRSWVKEFVTRRRYTADESQKAHIEMLREARWSELEIEQRASSESIQGGQSTQEHMEEVRARKNNNLVVCLVHGSSKESWHMV
jgi:hypothetical protein